MAEKTAGQQLKKGFYFIIIFMILVFVVAFTSIFIIQSSLKSIQKNVTMITEFYQPIIKSTERINSNSLEAELSLMRYIAEYDKDINIVSAQVRRLNAELDKTISLVNAQDLKDKLMNMSIIVKKMEKTVRLIGMADTWERKDELVNDSFRLSENIVKTAGEIKESIYKDIEKKIAEIKQKNIDTDNTSNITKIVLFLVFVLTIVNIVIMFRWWNRFQEFLLEF